jgi:hypothetical protein
MTILNGNLNGFLRTNADATTTSPTRLTNHSPVVYYFDGLHKTDAFGARAAARTPAGHRNRYPLHPAHFGPNPGREVGQYSPKTTTRTAIANREQFVARPNSKPHSIQLVTTDQMHQAGLTATLLVFQGFFLRHLSPKPRVDPRCRFPQKKTPQLNRIVLAVIGLTTDTEVHNPMRVGFLDEMFHHLRGKDDVIWNIKGAIDLDCPDNLVLREIEHIIVFEKPMVHNAVNERRLCPAGQVETAWKYLLKEFHKPQGTTHNDTS